MFTGLYLFLPGLKTDNEIKNATVHSKTNYLVLNKEALQRTADIKPQCHNKTGVVVVAVNFI